MKTSIKNDHLTPIQDFFEKIHIYQNKAMNTEEEANIEQFLQKMNLNLFSFPSNEIMLQIFNTSLKKNFQKNWNLQDKLLLIWTVFYYLRLNNIESYQELERNDWDKISLILNKNSTKCALKFHSALKSQMLENAWTPDEDNLLFSIVSLKRKNELPFQWIDVAYEFFEKSPYRYFRTEKMCRERWIFHLDPSLNNSPWNENEDLILLKRYLKYNNKWMIIGQKLKGRSVYSIQNRFSSLCKKFNLNPSGQKIEQQIKKKIKKITSQKVKIIKNSNIQKNFEILHFCDDLRKITFNKLFTKNSNYDRIYMYNEGESDINVIEINILSENYQNYQKQIMFPSISEIPSSKTFEQHETNPIFPSLSSYHSEISFQDPIDKNFHL